MRRPTCLPPLLSLASQHRRTQARGARALATLLWALVAVSGCGDEPAVATQPDLLVTIPPAPDFRGRTVYEIFLRSFADSDGDGVGDLKGLIAHLDDLNDGNPLSSTALGVDALWLMPVFPSPSYHGYDVTDYQGINPQYGTLADFDALIAAAHQRGIKVVLDLVLNHSSSKHPWFVDSSGSVSSARRGFYSWRDVDPKWSKPWDPSSPWVSMNGAYYYALFSPTMPDLNVQNPEVEAALADAARFWLARGVDGFRLDAVRYFVESPDGKLADQPETHDFLKRLRKAVSAAAPEAQLIGEAWAPLEVQARYYGSGDELQLTFSFDLASAILSSVRKGDVSDVVNVLARAERTFADRNFEAPFLTNHDQVRVARAFEGDRVAARVAAAVLMALPGTPFLYYGEEIGMLGGAGNDDVNKRTPMRWTADAKGHGFTTGTPWTSSSEMEGVDVATQKADPGSLWNHYRALIGLRRRHLALREGSAERVTVSAAGGGAAPASVMALARTKGAERVLFVANVDTKAVSSFSVAMNATQATILHSEGMTGSPTVASGNVSIGGLGPRGFAYLLVQ